MMHHCTTFRTRQSPPSAWPLRRADGSKFYEPRRDDEPRLPLDFRKGAR